RITIAGQAGDNPIQTTLGQLTRPLEAAVSTVPGVSRVRSTTARGSVSLDVTFADGTDMQLALQRVQSLIAPVQTTLPPGSSVTAAVLNPSIFPIMGYSLTSNKVDLVALRQTALYTLRPRLVRLPGVAQIRVTGGNIPEFQVSVRPLELQARGLTMQDVVDALAKSNSIVSVSQFDRSYQRYEVLVSGLLQNPDDIRRVVIATKNRAPILVSDVADVRASVQKPTILATGDGKPGVILNVIKQPDANTLQVADEVHQTLQSLTSSLPTGVTLSRFYDQSEIVAQSETSVVESIVVGGILALIVLVLFLGNMRVATVVLIQLPLTLLITFSLMRLLGQTLNIMSLGALAIAMGMVIDDGIVVVENIYHELEQGRTRREAVAAGMQGITPALVGSSLTTMVTFLPLTFLAGVTGQFFAPLALVMIATLAVSLALALVFTPLISGYILPSRAVPHSQEAAVPHKKSAFEAILGFFPGLFDRAAGFFGRVLLACIRYRVVVLLFSIGSLIGGYFLYSHLATGFFPEFDEGAFVIDYILPAGTSLNETDRTCREVEALLGKTPDIASWSRLTGALSGSGLELTEQNQGDILVRLQPQRNRTAGEIMDDVRKQIEASHPTFQVDMIQILQDGIGDIAGSPSPIEVKIFGADTATLGDLAHKAGAIIAQTPGVVDENDGIVESGPELIVKVDNRRASQAGLTTDAITTAAAGALRGTIATTVQQGEIGIGVRVQADTAQAYGTDMTQALPNIPVAVPGSARVPLRSVARVSIVPGSPQVTREDQQMMVAVTARLQNRDLGSAVKDVQARLHKQLVLPPGYRIEFGGLYASQQQSFAQLATVLVITVLLVSTMLLIQLREFGQTFSLLIAAILSLVGVMLGLYLTHTPLNLSSFTGTIMVVGIITEDGIVFFEVVNHLRKAHPEHSVVETVMEARRLRLRPILMTILAAILALLPLALGIGAGAAMQKPLAIAVIGGLIASTVYTLLVAPTCYIALEEFLVRFARHNDETDA
ncbi:MAG: Cation/multidrug efflux pump, partial [Chthonomonadaceae bacterium]|nr:Cation/multidrug efflux pump [Chthonomonadaceae bacterium]